MSILKVARLFEGKLALASGSLSADLQKIMAAASDLVKSYDIYDDAYDAANNLASKAYQFWNMSKNPTQAVPASVVSGWIQSLVNSAANVAKVATDPKGAAKLRTINSMIAAVQPMDIGPQDDGSTAKQEPEKSWMQDQSEQLMNDKLQETVRGLAPKPNPWDPEALEPWKVD